MTALVPPEFLFRCTFPVRRLDAIPRRGKRLLQLPESCVLPSLAELSGRANFGEIRLAWNEQGLGIGLSVTGKKQPASSVPQRSGKTDGMRVWIDTRNTHSVHRATRFCHQFEILPVGGKADGAGAAVIPQPVARANEDAPRIDPELIPVQTSVTSKGYRVEAWLPAAALNGFDPLRQPLLGFFYAIQDSELGLQTLSVGTEFPFSSDPSLWSTLELTPTPA
jgi:hypothetical protein